MLRVISLVLTVLTGFSGLVYEVTWQRYLATLLGSHSEATAAVLGIFLGGLALGYSLFGALTRRLETARSSGSKTPHLLAVYGVLELSIGIYAVLFPWLFRVVQAISLWVPAAGGGLSFAVDVLLAALLIGPPAILMGGTIPILTQALSRGLSDATRFHALVYGLNTAGACAGALAAGFWLIPRLGLVDVLLAMAGINIFVGLVFLALSKWSPTTDLAPKAATPAEESRVEGYAIYISVALLTGFAMMTLQTVLIRIAALSLGTSQFTFSMIVAVFVLCIAVGSLSVSLASRIPRRLIALNQWGLFLLFFALYYSLQDSPYWAHSLRVLFVSQPAGFYPYHLSAFVGILAVIGLPVALSGATLPLIFDHLRRQVENLGGAAGTLYSWNTLGSLLGALLGGYALLFWMDLHAVYRIALGALAAAGAATSLLFVDKSDRRLVALVLLIGLGAIAVMPAWEPYRLSLGLYRTREAQPDSFHGPDPFFAIREQSAKRQGFELLYYADGPTASIALKKTRSSDGVWHRNILTNGKSDGSIPGDYLTMGLLGLLPAVLIDSPERGFVIGFGTGVSVGELAALESMKQVIVAEISSAVVEAAPHFDEFNQGASVNPKVEFVRSDAYRALLRSEGQFDVIASEPSNPWVSGVEMLYSVEFIEAARAKLKPGGIYLQWVHGYETDDATIQLVLSTFRSVFQHVAVWNAMSSDFLIVGFLDPEAALDIERVRARAERHDVAAGLSRCGIDSFAELLAHELLPLGAVQDAALPAEVHTLLRPILSDVAARAFFAPPSEANLPVAAGSQRAVRSSLVQRYLGTRGKWPSEQERLAFVEETCEYRERECMAVVAEWFHDDRDSAVLEQFVSRFWSGSDTPPLERIDELAALYSPVPADDLEGADALSAAKLATRHYARDFHYGAPFSSRRLTALWERCEADPKYAERCKKRRIAATARFGL